jgi:cell division protein FtsB
MKLRMALWTLTVLAAIGVGLYLSQAPWQVYSQQRQKAAREQAEMKSVDEEHARLIEQLAELESSAGPEALARSRGYLKTGEVPVEQE